MSVQRAIDDAARRYLRAMNLDVDEVISVEQEQEFGGVCDTCRWSEVVVVIRYTDHDDEWQRYTYRGDFGKFITALDEADREATR